jgi:hypothetical protein
VAKTFNDLQPVLIFLAGAVMTVARFITDNLTAVLVTVGLGLLAYYTIVAAVTVLNFLEAASKSALVIATGSAIVSMYGFISTMAGTIAGMVRTAAVYAAQHIATGAIILAKGLMVAAAFLIAIWPITLFVAAIGATIYIFKKFGGDLSVVKDGLLIMWEGYKMFLNYFKLGLLKVLDYFLDMGDAIEQTEKDIAANKQEAVDRANNIQNTMDKNRKLAQEEQLAEEKREREEAERNRKMEEQRNQKPPAPPPMPAPPSTSSSGSGMGGGMGGGAGGAAVTGDTSSAAAVPGLDYNNQGGDDFLKAYAAREGSSFVPPPPAQPKTPTPAQPVTPTTPAGAQQAQAGAARTQLEADAAKAAQEKQAAAAAAAAKPPPEKPPQENSSALLAELNNKMATLIKYTYTVAHNTNENVTATRGLSKDVYKA